MQFPAFLVIELTRTSIRLVSLSSVNGLSGVEALAVNSDYKCQRDVFLSGLSCVLLAMWHTSVH